MHVGTSRAVVIPTIWFEHYKNKGKNIPKVTLLVEDDKIIIKPILEDLNVGKEDNNKTIKK